ncbi:hypothetical protein QIH80_20515 [Bradyrhizobium elkanii]|nr:hypothetical protein QIH80_20515 [Bradyrhizobium elkanii]
MVKVTCFWRSALLVVAEQCRSIVAVDHQRNAVRRGHREVVDGDVRYAELLLHGIDDLQADVERKADRPLIVVEIAEGNGSLLKAERDLLRFLDLLQRARRLLRRRGACGERESEEDGGQTQSAAPVR